MKAKQTILLGGVACGTLAILGGLFAPGLYYRDASAVTWDSSNAGRNEDGSLKSRNVGGEVNVQFTFNQTLSMELTGGDLVINGLTPGQSAVSNEINIKTTTNSASGYTLKATIGGTIDKVNYDTTSLENGTAVLTSINDQTADGTALTAGTWGYLIDKTATNADGGYNGFDSTKTATIKTMTTPATNGDNVKFKIGAYAKTDQPSGTYKNVITFSSTANVDTDVTQP